MRAGTVLLKPERLIFFVGVNTGYVTNCQPDQRLLEFYRLRSSPRLHCVLVGNVVIPGGHASNAATPVMSDAAVWADLANTIRLAGCVPGMQLSTAWGGYVGAQHFRETIAGQAIRQAREIVRGLGRPGWERAMRSLNQGTMLARRAGFGHLQIHAAHGYLFSLLVDQRINPDATEFLASLSDWALEQSSHGLETSIRFSLRTGDPQFDADGAGAFHAQMAGLPFDFVDASSGFYNVDKRLIYPGRPDVIHSRRAETVELAQTFPDRAFIMSGRALDQPDDDLPANVHIGLCRDLIANPGYLEERHRGCINSGKCHYFSRGEPSLTCSQWT
jgi:2,4-dienoyl-CoA reductase-like NADH-dependent reductase (Old Yellow Enzyme family)